MKTKGIPKIKSWPKRPLIFEINTWVWPQELSQAQGRPVTLADVPDQEWDALAALIEEADWATLQERMAAHNFNGERIIRGLVEDHTVK